MTDYESSRHWKPLILFTYFSLGAFALISQTMLLREFFVVVYGNEFIFGVLLTNWLVGIFFGALTGAALSERNPDNLLVFVISILVMSVLLPLSITLTRLLYTISGTETGTYIGFFKVFLYSALFIIPISFFIGFVFPIAAKAQSQLTPNYTPHPSTRNTPSNTLDHQVKRISNIYIFEALGSLFSGVIYTFFLVGQFSSYLIAALIILPLLTCANITLFKLHRFRVLPVSLLLLLLTIILLIPPINQHVEQLTVKNRWRSMSILPLTYSTDSRYQNIAVAEISGQYNLYLNTMFSTAFPNDTDNQLLAAHLICQHPAPRRILIIGDAVSGLAKNLLRFPVDLVVSIEIDPKTVETILQFLPNDDKTILKDPRFQILIRDGRKYVKDLLNHHHTTPHTFDLVFLNISEPSTLLLNRYYTHEFFSDIKKILPPNGVLALRITSSENYQSGLVSNYTASIYHTVKSVFPHLAVTPGTENFIFASPTTGNVSDNPDLLASRYYSSHVQPQKLALIFSSYYPKEKTRFIKNALENLNPLSIRLNTDNTPIACLYFNKIIGWYGENNLTSFLGFFEKVNLSHLAAIILLFLLLRMTYLTLNKNPRAYKKVLRFHTLLAVFSAGMAGLALEMVILYTFQSHFGNIYFIIGFVIAVFMSGLPLGAAAANSLILHFPGKDTLTRESQVIQLVILTLTALGIIAIALPYTMKLFSRIILIHQIIIIAETIFIGFAVGFLFPLSIHLYMDNRKETGKTAGIINAFDHIGAAVGAFFIGTLFLPVIGVEKVCILIAIFPFISAFLLFTDHHRLKLQIPSTHL